MPGKRRFTKKNIKRYKKGTRKFKSLRAGRVGKGNADTMIYAKSNFQHNIMPSRYFSWYEINMLGYWAVGAGGLNANGYGYFAFALNTLALPLNQAGGATTIPNPISALNAIYPNGLRDLMYSNNTGVYNFGRVWRVTYEVGIMPAALSDDCSLTVVPVKGNALYGSYTTASQGSYNQTKLMSSSQNRTNIIRGSISLPQFLGIPKRTYSGTGDDAANPSTIFALQTFAGGAVNPSIECYLQCHVQTLDQATNTVKLPIYLKVKYYTELFNRQDQGLTD